ncbi:hypothetical protein MMO38_01450 [Acinetobacter sp. NIPH 1852]|uniref:hypothetical protein n=1 Tax=Acinetobacter sp. NIPH 1852 TaxID=2923428 RepID=UPI001F4A1642|nr:hypothetical protein [Acinetobacter sp. NIPH 1852]MCH7306809.1 hypothetical protein [Acinetobacter sp. NIPH 1852]
MIISNHNDYIANKYYNYLNKLGFFAIIPISLSLFLAKNTGADSLFIQKVAIFCLILSIFYLTTNLDKTSIAYKKIAKDYMKAHQGFLGQCSLIYRTFVFLLSFTFLGGLTLGIF